MLHLIERGGISRRVVHVKKAGPLRQQGLELGVLTGAEVIDDQVELQILGHLLVDASKSLGAPVSETFYASGLRRLGMDSAITTPVATSRSGDR